MLHVGLSNRGAGVRPLKRTLTALEQMVSDRLRAALSEQAHVSLERVKTLTPLGERDEETAHIPHIRDQWFLKEWNAPNAGPSKGGASRGYLGVIDHPYNTPGKTRPPIKFVGSDGKRYTGARYLVNDGEHNVLADLEYGTKAHTISAHGVRTRAQSLTKTTLRTRKGALVTKRYLRFKIGGRIVFTGDVFHPGTKPYYMTRLTEAEANRDLIPKLRTILRDAATMMRQGGK